MMSSSLYFDYPEHFLVSYQALPKLMYIFLPKKTIHFRFENTARKSSSKSETLGTIKQLLNPHH